MRLARDGREWVTFLTSDTSGGTISASFDVGVSWVPLEVVDDNHARALVAGPDAVGNPPQTVVVEVGSRMLFLRFGTGVESVIRVAPDHLVVEP